MKYQASAVIKWDFESEGDAFSEAIAYVKNKFPEFKWTEFKIIKKPNCSLSGNIVLGEFGIDDVLPYITTSSTYKEYKINGVSHMVKMNSHRYFVFQKSLECAACGLKGTKFLLEQHSGDENPHFNLYGEEKGENLLFTKDHIIPAAHHGLSDLSNYTTCCAICNNLKSDLLLSYEAVRKLRLIFNANKHRMTRRELSALIRAEKEKLLIEV